MRYREIIAVCSEIHTKHINTLCGQNVAFFSAFTNMRKTNVSVSIFGRVSAFARMEQIDIYWTDCVGGWGRRGWG
jgi:hypothetical protein